MIKRVLLLLLVTVVGSSTFGQGLTTYNMDMIPQSTRTNPGIMPKAKFHLGLPVISYLDMSLVNTGFVFSDLFSSSTDISTAELVKSLKKDNYLSLNLNVDLLSFGFKIKEKNYFSFNVTERVAFNFDYSKDFMRLLAEGTAPFIGQTMSMSGTGFRFSSFCEYGLGYTRQFNDRLSVGTKFKLLQGLSHINSEDLDIKLATDATDYSLTATSTIGFRTAGLGFLTDSNKKFDPLSYLTNWENKGFAIDLGGNYKLTDKISVSASLTDIGLINWKTDARRYYNNKAEFTWSGLDIMKYLTDTAASRNYASHLADSLQNVFGLKKDELAFSTKLVGNMYLGGQYKFNKWFNAGAVFHGQLFANHIYPSFTALGGVNLGKMMQISASYSILNSSYTNLGAAFALNLGPVQIYAAGDNVFGFTQMDYAKTLNARIGINIMTGYSKKMSKEEKKNEKIKRDLSKKDTDQDGVNDYEDKCIDKVGKPEHKGCPDQDGDGVADNEDICPTEFGHSETGGCPDADNDGVADRTDQCPTEYGKIKGCPDLDKDSIPDKDDACPNVAGALAMKGCPDRDNDQLSDADDMCPLLKGDLAHGGCPDSDGDGVFDNEDKCPKDKGTVELKGCTNLDTDHDTVPDVLDACPFRAGTPETNGCPVQ